MTASARPSSGAPVRLTELLAAWSLAIDVAMNLPLDTGLQVCVRATELARAADADVDVCRRTHQLALLRHVGCTAENATMAAVVGDERAFRAGLRGRDASSSRALLSYLVKSTVEGLPLLRRPSALIRLLTEAGGLNVAFAAVCEVAQELVDRIGLDVALRDDVTMVYERYDGRGVPNRRPAEAISLPAQLVHLAEAITEQIGFVGPDAVVPMLRERRGKAFDPGLVDLALQSPALLSEFTDDAWAATLSAEPGSATWLPPRQVDEILCAFADFVDLKSRYTVGHSREVAALAEQAAEELGLPEHERSALRRAGWLHDAGRLAVSVQVWEKPAALSSTDLEQVRLHPYVTERILARSAALRPLGKLAGSHHERVDGSGYHRGQRGEQLPMTARILAAADAYAAAIRERSFRPALSSGQAAGSLRETADAGALDPVAVEAVLAAAGHRRRADHAPLAGLTPRELEVLCLLARGMSNPEIAAALVISRKTVEHHLESAYAKLGVRTRAAATMRALRMGLVAAPELVSTGS
jgi:HD-GYP domain-containing protein (c-di-GMP phosphodiesterase class II)